MKRITSLRELLHFWISGINKWAVNFSKFEKNKWQEPVGRMQFEVWKINECLFIPNIAREKSFDYLLIIYMQFNLSFLHSISAFCTRRISSVSALFGIDVLSAKQYVEIFTCIGLQKELIRVCIGPDLRLPDTTTGAKWNDRKRINNRMKGSHVVRLNNFLRP